MFHSCLVPYLNGQFHSGEYSLYLRIQFHYSKIYFVLFYLKVLVVVREVPNRKEENYFLGFACCFSSKTEVVDWSEGFCLVPGKCWRREKKF